MTQQELDIYRKMNAERHIAFLHKAIGIYASFAERAERNAAQHRAEIVRLENRIRAIEEETETTA